MRLTHGNIPGPLDGEFPNSSIPQLLLRASCIGFGIMAFGDLEQIQ